MMEGKRSIGRLAGIWLLDEYLNGMDGREWSLVDVMIGAGGVMDDLSAVWWRIRDILTSA